MRLLHILLVAFLGGLLFYLNVKDAPPKPTTWAYVQAQCYGCHPNQSFMRSEKDFRESRLVLERVWNHSCPPPPPWPLSDEQIAKYEEIRERVLHFNAFGTWKPKEKGP
jgi:hypothetical protein